MCQSCDTDHSPPSRWALIRGAIVLSAGAVAAALLLILGDGSHEGRSPGTSNTDRVFASDIRSQQAEGQAIADAGMRSTVPAVRRVAEELSSVERNHTAGVSVAGAAPGAIAEASSERRFVDLVRDHLEADILIARIERSDGVDRSLQRQAVIVTTQAKRAMAALPSV